MSQSNRTERRCTYLVVMDADAPADLTDLSRHLSMLGLSGAEVVVVDGSAQFEEHARTLRWVSRHLPAEPRHLDRNGSIDAIRAAVEIASCERVVVAGPQVRHTAESLEQLCSLLDRYEVVGAQEYFDPMPWWCGVETGMMLLARGLDTLADHGDTYGFRKSAVRELPSVEGTAVAEEKPLRRLVSQGAEVFAASELFVRRLPTPLNRWLRQRGSQAGADFTMMTRTVPWLALLPLAILLGLIGGWPLAGYTAAAFALASLVIAFRGRLGAASVFPLRACLFAPLWVAERSITVYWALLSRLRAARIEVRPAASARAASEEKVVSSSQRL